MTCCDPTHQHVGSYMASLCAERRAIRAETSDDLHTLARIYRTDNRFSYSSDRRYLRPFGDIAYLGFVDSDGRNYRFRTAIYSYSRMAPTSELATEMTYRWRRVNRGR